jgi:hypothetical protein
MGSESRSPAPLLLNQPLPQTYFLITPGAEAPTIRDDTEAVAETSSSSSSLLCSPPRDIYSLFSHREGEAERERERASEREREREIFHVSANKRLQFLNSHLLFLRNTPFSLKLPLALATSLKKNQICKILSDILILIFFIICIFITIIFIKSILILATKSKLSNIMYNFIRNSKMLNYKINSK